MKKHNRYRQQMLISRGVLILSLLILIGVGFLLINHFRSAGEKKAGREEVKETEETEQTSAVSLPEEQAVLEQDTNPAESADAGSADANVSDPQMSEGADSIAAEDAATGDSGSENGATNAGGDETANASTDAEASNASETPITEESAAADEKNDAEIKTLLQGMSLEEKLYQMFIVTPEQLTDYQIVVAAGDASKAAYEKKPVGGLIYFAQNLQNPDQTKEMLTNMQQYATDTAKVPLFLAVDEEGGRVARVAENTGFGVENVGPMSEIKSAEDAGKAGKTIGTYLKDLGFNLDFAPDADVLTEPENTVVKDRSFGSDPETVAKCAKAYSDGLHEAGILSCYKHFPGHGATKGDTHNGLAFTDKTLEQLKESELIPFQNAEKDGADFVMVAHISLPEVLSDDTPCSLSDQMITDILRKDCGYHGLVITDALNMGAITQAYGADQAAVMAVKAGADMVLMPQNFKTAYAALLEAVKNGEIKEEQIDASVTRILKAKLKLT